MFNFKSKSTTEKHEIAVIGERDYHIVSVLVDQKVKRVNVTFDDGRFIIQFECKKEVFEELKDILMMFRQIDQIRMRVEFK